MKLSVGCEIRHRARRESAKLAVAHRWHCQPGEAAVERSKKCGLEGQDFLSLVPAAQTPWWVHQVHQQWQSEFSSSLMVTTEIRPLYPICMFCVKHSGFVSMKAQRWLQTQELLLTQPWEEADLECSASHRRTSSGPTCATDAMVIIYVYVLIII